ncbi:MAG: polysaccharide deacetylase family protein [Lautropia sp.]
MFRSSRLVLPATPANDLPHSARPAAPDHPPSDPASVPAPRRLPSPRRLARLAIDRLLIPACHRLGLLHLCRRLFDRHALTVVMFHRVLPLDGDACRHAEREYVVGTDEFDRCLDFFGRHYSVVSMLAIERAAAGLERLPPHPLLITFDDGWRDNLVHAEPLLRRHGMKAALFVNVDAVREPGTRWWQDALVEVVTRESAGGSADGPFSDLYGAIRAMVRLTPDARWAALAPRLDWSPETRQMLTADEVASLDPTVWDIGSHGLSHAPLTEVSDPEAEIVESGRWLAATCGVPVRAMSLPHGRLTASIARIARTTYPLVFTSDPVLKNTRRRLGGLIGRLHLPSAAASSDRSLARFLWIRSKA